MVKLYSFAAVQVWNFFQIAILSWSFKDKYEVLSKDNILFQVNGNLLFESQPFLEERIPWTKTKKFPAQF